jgi:hypothetical protein
VKPGGSLPLCHASFHFYGDTNVAEALQKTHGKLLFVPEREVVMTKIVVFNASS